MFSRGLDAWLIAQCWNGQEVDHDGTLLTSCTKADLDEHIDAYNKIDAPMKGRDYGMIGYPVETFVYVDNGNDLIGAKLTNCGEAFYFIVGDHDRHFSPGNNAH